MPTRTKNTLLDVVLGLTILGLPVLLAGCMVVGLAASVPVGFALLPPLVALGAAMALTARSAWQETDRAKDELALPQP